MGMHFRHYSIAWPDFIEASQSAGELSIDGMLEFIDQAEALSLCSGEPFHGIKEESHAVSMLEQVSELEDCPNLRRFAESLPSAQCGRCDAGPFDGEAGDYVYAVMSVETLLEMTDLWSRCEISALLPDDLDFNTRRRRTALVKYYSAWADTIAAISTQPKRGMMVLGLG